MNQWFFNVFDYNNYPGMKRGQSPVVPFFRGGEGDRTFNGFVLSSIMSAKKSSRHAR
jgi:hypothetical protein